MGVRDYNVYRVTVDMRLQFTDNKFRFGGWKAHTRDLGGDFDPETV
jgi:hypothetical protein